MYRKSDLSYIFIYELIFLYYDFDSNIPAFTTFIDPVMIIRKIVKMVKMDITVYNNKKYSYKEVQSLWAKQIYNNYKA